MTPYWTECELLAFPVSLGVIVASFFCILVFVRLPIVVYRKEPWRNALKYRITDPLPILALAAALWIENVAGPRVKALVCSPPEIAALRISHALAAHDTAGSSSMPPRPAGFAKSVNVHQSRAALPGASA